MGARAGISIMSSTEPRLSPRRMVRSNLCIGCGGCAAAGDAIDMRMNGYGQFRPMGQGASASSEALAEICPFSPQALNEDEIAARVFPDAPFRNELIGRYEAAYVGHAEDAYRETGSSGGMTSFVAAELLRLKLVDGVAHVLPGNTSAGEPLFAYRISRSIDDVRRGAKSRYYPVELSSVLREMREVDGRYAIIGIPCFIKSVRLLCARDPVLAERIVFTLGLFCGHMKSARMAESFAWQLGADLNDATRFDFRAKHPERPANWYRADIELRDGSSRAGDWWHFVDGDWGAGFFQDSACNFCDDVVAETADVSFGDAWVEPYSSDGRGTNVVIVRNRVMQRLLEEAAAAGLVALEPVEPALVVATQAAGFRQRREGLAYRLTHHHGAVQPRKRVAPATRAAPLKRRAIYAMRERISRWSHRAFWLARTLRWPALYLVWARSTLSLYHAIAYSRGRLGPIADRLFGR